MRTFGWFALLSAGWILIELSFLDILLPSVRVPIFILAYAAALPIALGSRAGVAWAVGSAVAFDIMRSGDLTPAVLFVGVAAWATSLLIGRLHFDFGVKSRLSLSVWLIALVVAYDMAMLPFRWPTLLECALVLPISLLVLPVTVRLKAWLDFTSLSEFRGLRHS